MTRVLIADTDKASIVMTSEIFKDKIPGTTVRVVAKGADCLQALSEETFDMVVVDFDLPDTDGISLTHEIRETFKGPVLITAFPGSVVQKAINAELFLYDDASTFRRRHWKYH